MGVPRVLLSDNGTEFCNELNDTLNEVLGIKKRLTTPYHPQDSKGITILATGSHLKIFHPNPLASISESCKTSSVDDRLSEKDSLSHFQSDHDETKGSPLKPDIYVDDPSSEEDDDESSHSVQENSKESSPKSGIFFEEPPSEVESNHSSVHGDSNGSSLKSGIYVDNPSEEDDDESSHSVQENLKESPLKSGIFVDQPPAEDESNHSVHEYSISGAHASDEDSTGASYCGCKTRCATRLCPCKQIGSVCRKYCHPNRTCVNRQQKPSEAELSCLSSEEETGISSGVKVWTTIGETTLLEEDKNVLINGGWLNDKIINAGMQLLQAAFPHLAGFQNPILQVTNCFDIQRSTEFIQCLNVAGMHWITIATVGCTHGTVRVYDSLNKKLTKSMKNTVADILLSSTKKSEVEYVNVQYQLGSDDCGLFAIANACEICFGRDPSVVKYTQKDMRKHLFHFTVSYR
eukprot:Em0013g1085a